MRQKFVSKRLIMVFSCCLILAARRPRCSFSFPTATAWFLEQHSIARHHRKPFSHRRKVVTVASYGQTSSSAPTKLFLSSAAKSSVRYLDGLNPSQIEAVTQPLSAVTRVVAGPGSGKTRVLTCRIAHLLEEDPDVRRILGVTFTRKAAGEMQQRLQNMFEGNSERLNRVTLGTFHSVCAKILRWNGESLSSLPSVIRDMEMSRNETLLDGNFLIIDQSESLRILKDCLQEMDIELKDSDVKPISVLSSIGDIKAEYAEGKDPYLPRPKNAKPYPKRKQAALKVYKLYREKLLAANCMDYDDLIFSARELLQDDDEVRRLLKQRWTHILVDEFQDTSRTQMDLVKLLTSSSLFVVGDADQSIYSWRGAHVGSLSDFADEFRDCIGDVSTVYLMENYRSTSNIVSVAQKVISQSKGEATGADKLRQSMKPKRPAGPPPRIIACGDDKLEAEFVVASVKEKLDAGTFGPETTAAVIYRTNAQSRAIEEACVSKNVPYVISGTATSFYSRQEVKDCLCFLRLLHNGRDKLAMIRALTTPKRGIGERAIQEFQSLCDHIEEEKRQNQESLPTPFEVLLSLSGESFVGDVDPGEFLSTRPMNLLTEFSIQIRSIHEIALNKPVEKVLQAVVEQLGIIPHLNKISRTDTEFNERKANVGELRRAASRHDKDGAALAIPAPSEGSEEPRQSPLANFLDDISLVTDMESSETESSGSRFALNLMTIHASKGMEFDSVYMIGLEEGTLPSIHAVNDNEGSVNLEEEKRLCYVAMTRAKTELCMTWRKEVPVFTKLGIKFVDRDRSRFLDSIVSKKKSPSPKRTVKTNSIGTPAKRAGASRQNYANNRYDRSYHTTRMRASSVKSSPHRTSKFEGTSKILAGMRRTDGRAHSSRPAERTQIQRKANLEQEKLRMTEPRNQHSHLGSRQSSVSKGVAKREKDPPSAKKRAKVFDSTLIFPVGSEVKHLVFGKGIVLNPPQTEDRSLVRIKFVDGETKDIPVESEELIPVLF